MTKRKTLTRILSLALVLVTLLSTLIISANAASYSTGDYMINTSSGLNVRTGAGSGYSRVGAASNGTKFYVSRTSGNWGYTSSIKCTNGTRSGWVCLDYCKKQASAPAPTPSLPIGKYAIASNSGSNIRTGAGTGYSKVGAAAKGVTFNVTKISGKWGYTPSIKCTNGYKSGWVCLDYCTYKGQTTNNNNNNSAAAIKLNVPLYKQGDSRWGYKYISTKTIAKVGCLITSIAMAYSYNTSTTVYPDAAMRKMSFSGNSLYWSSLKNFGLSYTTYNRSLNNSIMSTIYSKLKAGKPVIIGAQDANGNSQHWVVITGYTGTSTTSFSANNFIINDPGSQNCTTLSAFLANGSKADRTKILKICY